MKMNLILFVVQCLHPCGVVVSTYLHELFWVQVDTIGARTMLKAITGGALLIADHQVFVSDSGGISVLLLILLVAFNVAFIMACFPQLLVRANSTAGTMLHVIGL